MEEFEIKRSHLKGGILKSYKSADDWSANYLNDQLKNLKEYDAFGEWLRSSLAALLRYAAEETPSIEPITVDPYEEEDLDDIVSAAEHKGRQMALQNVKLALLSLAEEIEEGK